MREGRKGVIHPNPLTETTLVYPDAHHFQYTDLPHPDWEELVVSKKTNQVPDVDVTVTTPPDVNPWGNFLRYKKPTFTTVIF